jgi:hypothetical protein
VLGQEGYPSAPTWHERQFKKYYVPFTGPGINDPFHASAFSVTLVLAIETSPDIEQGSPSRVDASAWFKSDGGRVTNAMGARA